MKASSERTKCLVKGKNFCQAKIPFLIEFLSFFGSPYRIVVESKDLHFGWGINHPFALVLFFNKVG